jgi:hypothetical protein
VPADEPGPVEDAEPLLDGALGDPGEADELAGRERLVLAEEGEQVPVRRPGSVPPNLEKGSGERLDVRFFCVWARRSSC